MKRTSVSELLSCEELDHGKRLLFGDDRPPMYVSFPQDGIFWNTSCAPNKCEREVEQKRNYLYSAAICEAPHQLARQRACHVQNTQKEVMSPADELAQDSFQYSSYQLDDHQNILLFLNVHCNMKRWILKIFSKCLLMWPTCPHGVFQMWFDILHFSKFPLMVFQYYSFSSLFLLETMACLIIKTGFGT